MDSENQAKQMRATLSRTPAKQPMPAMPYGHMMPYGPMGRVSPTVMGMPTSQPMMPMPQAAMMGMTPYMMGMGNFGYPQGVGAPTGAGIQQTGKKVLPPSTYIRVSYPNFTKFTYAITKTCLYNFDSLKPHLSIVKLGFTGIYIIFFIISAQKYRLWVLITTASPRWFQQVPTIYVLSRHMKNIRLFFIW